MSALRLQKYRQWFLSADVDGDNVLTRQDTIHFADRYITLRGARADSPEAQRLRDMMEGFWVNVIAPFDHDGDGQVDSDEVVTGCERVLLASEGYSKQLEPIAEQYFQIADIDGDGKIDLQEFKQIFMAVGRGSDADCAEVFRRLDTDCSGALSRREYHRALEEFFYSDDPNAPGNQLFGPLGS
jgi:Ca2+-binding EF-hand superfamily protein